MGSSALSSYPTTLGGQLRRHVGAYVFGTLLLAAQQGLMFARDRLFKTGVDAAAGDRSHEAVTAAAIAIGVVVVASAVRVLSRVVMFNGGRAAEYELRAGLLSRLHTLGPSFFRKIPTGDILSRSTNDLTQVRLLLGFGVLNVVNTVFALTSALSVMLGVSTRLTVASLAAGPILLLVTRWFSRQVFLRTKETQEALGKMSERVQASLAGVRVVRSLALEEAEVAAFEKTSSAYLEKSLSLARLRGSMFPIMGSVSAIGMLTVFWYGGHLVLVRQITPGDFVAFWAALSRLIWPLLALGFVVSIVQRGRASWARLAEIYEAVPEVTDGPLPAPASIAGELRVSGLSMSYGERKVLDGVSFTVPEGTSLALVGRTGAGKSTLAALLPRLLPTPKATVFLDGIDVCDLPLSSVRHAIGYAQQDAFLFSTTVARNIGFSLDDPDSDAGHAKIVAVSQEAQIADEIDNFPEGFDTVVGERGVQLSGGQRQRVALARAFLWEPKVLVLDDPLSAVDAKTEARILDAIDRQARRRTLVLITHRVAAAARCDRVLVLDEGKVVEEGTPAELLRNGGLFAELSEEQRVEGELAKMAGPANVEAGAA
jgi:ATP-binding cassette, subfamily B, multidrug efflux pump